MNRRNFLKNSATAAAMLGAAPLWSKAAFARGARATAGTDTVLVTVNLFGGNDGMNTLVPLGQYDRYRQLRPTLALDRDEVLALPNAPSMGLNPTMTAMRSLYGSGRLAVIPGVGMPRDAEGLFDHERAQRSFQTGLASNYSDTRSGWIGRWLDSVSPGRVYPGVNMGGGDLLVAGDARTPISIYSLDDFQLRPSFDGERLSAAYDRIQGRQDPDGGAGELGRSQRRLALDMSAIVRENTDGYTPAVQYADTYLSSTMAQAAALINADIGVRAISVGIGGFDTHASQNDGGDGDPGYHSSLLGEVSDAVGAFQADLEGHGNASRVLGLVFSEFGRRPEENNDRGTDHGYASVMFAFGSAVRAGVYGDYPSLSDDRLIFDGNIDITNDYRSVYATVLGRFLGADPGSILGQDFPHLGFL